MLWLTVTPPKLLGRVSAIVAGLVLLILCRLWFAPGIVHTALMRWSALAGGLVWSITLFGWILLARGNDSFILLVSATFGLCTLGLVLTNIVDQLFEPDERKDAVVGLILVAASIAIVSLTAHGLSMTGVGMRLDAVQDRYERAIAEDRVEQTGGFVSGKYSGWDWSFSSFFGHGNAIVFDPSDNLDTEIRVTPGRSAYLNEEAECVRLEPQWFWCEFP